MLGKRCAGNQRSQAPAEAFWTTDSTCSDRTQPPLPTQTRHCDGISVRWDAGVFEVSYPFHLQADGSGAGLGYDLTSLSPPRARSKRCRRTIAVTEDACPACKAAQVEIDVLEEIARRPFDRVHSYGQLNYAQQRSRARHLTKQLQKMVLQELNASRSLKIARRHVKQHQEILEYAGQNLVPGLHRVLANALKQGWSAKKTLSYLIKAVNGEYHPRNYSQVDIDLAVILYSFGGASAVYAFNHSYLALPSLNTIQPHRRLYRMTVSTEGIRLTDIASNIDTVYGPHESPRGGLLERSVPLERCGLTLAIDETMIEAKVEYVQENDTLGGPCFEHSNRLKSVRVGDDCETVKAAVAAVRDGTVHIATEVSVGAISRLARTGYAARPVFLIPTCKKRSYAQSVELILYTLEAWDRSENGAKKYGPIFNVASDGDAIRRASLFTICMCEEVRVGHPLWEYLHELFPLGLNPRIGKNSACTLVCSKDGMFINGVKVNPALLHIWLERIPNRRWPDTSIESLLQPDDAQDVPRAIKLLWLIADIRTINTDGMDPHELEEFTALCILGEMFEALVLPFVEPALTLSEQYRYLVKFSHILSALYARNGRDFCSNQLYNDFQCMVKAAVYLIAKTLRLNPKLGVYFCLLGDDVVEALFGLIRMLGGHSPNASLLQFKQRAEAAINLAAVFERYPQLERLGRRLQLRPIPGAGMRRARDMDHIRPPTWHGEVAAESCDLVGCWKEGARAAEAALDKYKVRMDMSFTERFARPNTDLMRPLGGKYPAISNDIDRSVTGDASPHAESPTDTTIPTSLADGTTTTLDIDFDTVLAREKAEIAAHAVDGHSAFAKLNEDGVFGPKKSIVSVHFNLGSERLSHERNWRLRDLFATLVSPNGKDISIAIVKPLVIKQTQASKPNPVHVPSAPISEVQLVPSPYVVSGQVLALKPLDGEGAQWVWEGNYVGFSASKRKESALLPPGPIRDSTVTVVGSLVRPIAYSRVEAEDLQDANLDIVHDATWVINNTELRSAWSDLWKVIRSEQGLQVAIPVYGEAHNAYPYMVRQNPAHPRGMIWATSATTANIVLKSKQQACTICSRANVKDTDRQRHMGEHLLKVLLHVGEPSKTRAVSSQYPCGFCGGPGVGENACGIGIKSGAAHSNCPRAYAFMLHAARKFDEKRPCTNVPVVCTFPYCGQTHWKYNYHQHFTDRHPSWRDEMPLDSELATAIRIGEAEQAAMGIPKAQICVWPPLPASVDGAAQRGVSQSLSSIQRVLASFD
uniref:Uncharacterized protein n=1 Tax=Schizophyllum commune (strain H4-8 / FGSC 9210) TaxID=578458 RepID=D8Q4A2_SCHCM